MFDSAHSVVPLHCAKASCCTIQTLKQIFKKMEWYATAHEHAILHVEKASQYENMYAIWDTTTEDAFKPKKMLCAYVEAWYLRVRMTRCSRIRIPIATRSALFGAKCNAFG